MIGLAEINYEHPVVSSEFFPGIAKQLLPHAVFSLGNKDPFDVLRATVTGLFNRSCPSGPAVLFQSVQELR